MYSFPYAIELKLVSFMQWKISSLTMQRHEICVWMPTDLKKILLLGSCCPFILSPEWACMTHIQLSTTVWHSLYRVTMRPHLDCMQLSVTQLYCNNSWHGRFFLTMYFLRFQIFFLKNAKNANTNIPYMDKWKLDNSYDLPYLLESFCFFFFLTKETKYHGFCNIINRNFKFDFLLCSLYLYILVARTMFGIH